MGKSEARGARSAMPWTLRDCVQGRLGNGVARCGTFGHGCVVQ